MYKNDAPYAYEYIHLQKYGTWDRSLYVPPAYCKNKGKIIIMFYIILKETWTLCLCVGTPLFYVCIFAGLGLHTAFNRMFSKMLIDVTAKVKSYRLKHRPTGLLHHPLEKHISFRFCFD